MKNFDNKTEEVLNSLMDKSSESYDSGKLKESFNYLSQAYDTIPEPRREYNEAYNYCSYVLDFILEENYNLNESKAWLEKLEDISEFQGCWEGSIDFFKAKTNFRLGKFNEAKKSFDESVKIGRGMRYFEDEDPVYKDFYLNPEKYINS